MTRSFDAAQVRDALPSLALVAALRDAFRGNATTPTRHHHRIPVPGSPEAMLLLMPSWMEGRYVGVKIVSVFPGNAARGLDSAPAETTAQLMERLYAERSSVLRRARAT